MVLRAGLEKIVEFGSGRHLGRAQRLCRSSNSRGSAEVLAEVLTGVTQPMTLAGATDFRSGASSTSNGSGAKSVAGAADRSCAAFCIASCMRVIVSLQ